MSGSDRKYTFNLTNFNLASDALQRASRIASVYDTVEIAQQIELRKALNVELDLCRRLMDMVENKTNHTPEDRKSQIRKY